MTALRFLLAWLLVSAVLSLTFSRRARSRREAWRRWRLQRWRDEALAREARAEELDRLIRALAAVPGIEVVQVQGARVPIRDLPREQLLAPPREWAPGLRAYAMFNDAEKKA